MAGSICPVEVMKRCINDMHMEAASIAYGMTETSPRCRARRAPTTTSSVVRRRSAGSTRTSRSRSSTRSPARPSSAGSPGEFCTRGYSVMLGYWDDPEKTAEAIDADGWMHTGDLAEMREDGYCNIVGRIKDMVIRGGENVYPREIEEFLYAHPDIEDVQVIGVPDEKYGEELCAWIKLRDGADPLDADAVRAFATGKLAHYKIPRYVMLVDEFPMTVTGKIRKVQMREETADEARPHRRRPRPRPVVAAKKTRNKYADPVGEPSISFRVFPPARPPQISPGGRSALRARLVGTDSHPSRRTRALSDELRQLADDYWQAILDEEPTERHLLGDYSDVGSYEEVSREAEQRYVATLRDFATRAEAVEEGSLDPEEVLTRGVIISSATAHADLLDTAVGVSQRRPGPRGPGQHGRW